VSATQRLHPALLIHTTHVGKRRRLVAQVSASRAPLVFNHPLALTALALLPGDFDRLSAGEAWREGGVEDRDHDALWAAFSDAGLFVDGAGDPSDRWWATLGWREAHAYHWSTRDYPFLQMDQPAAWATDARRMNGYRDRARAPAEYLNLGTDAHVDLVRLGPNVSPDDRLAGMATADRLGKDGLGLLLDVCFGERGQLMAAGDTRCVLKSIPSGGARHPTEVYVASLAMPGVPAGIYHYNVEHHRLCALRNGDHRAELEQATCDLFVKHDRPPVAALFFTSLVERAMWRYRDPRSFRAILFDVGHAVAAYRYAARILGFRTYAAQKMRDREVAELLGVDPVVQPPLYAATLVPPADHE
jgi:SagB-type dehydrogenase family enzyme